MTKLFSLTAHGYNTEDKHGLAEYIKALEEKVDARHSVGNKHSSFALDQNEPQNTKRNYLESRNLEQRYCLFFL